jgi:hypothetical protein
MHRFAMSLRGIYYMEVKFKADFYSSSLKSRFVYSKNKIRTSLMKSSGIVAKIRAQFTYEI